MLQYATSSHAVFTVLVHQIIHRIISPSLLYLFVSSDQKGKGIYIWPLPNLVRYVFHLCGLVYDACVVNDAVSVR
jgi:hypothetical protein